MPVFLHEAYLRQEFSRMGTAALHGERLDGASRLEALLARELRHPEELRTARANIAASAAILPIAPEMAWAVPQLLKRIQLVSPGILSTSGVLRSLIRMPELDEQFAKAFADSGFLSCDQAIERVRWKYDVSEMLALHHGGSAWQVLEHCRVLLMQHRTKQPLDWEGVLIELQTLLSWFPELRTIQLLEQLYARLRALHTKSVLAAQCWLDWRTQGAHHA
ncbi:hypothetical protein [Caenimonas soli]|uniref:hypothetical protein n=1 Tax=Caenimonas soli TaxID=2735555 RepID=UPI001557C82E|nr:hypothetical protein [Caenimonas soli]NPC54832.1 hypothetical protein [Caenimonas soli]